MIDHLEFKSIKYGQTPVLRIQDVQVKIAERCLLKFIWREVISVRLLLVLNSFSLQKHIQSFV